jgi:hypothetical protein
MKFIKSYREELQKQAWWDQVEGGGRESSSFPSAFKTYINL